MIYPTVNLALKRVISFTSTHVDEIDNSVDLGDLLMGVGNHVPLKTRNGNGELLVANSVLDLLQELGVALNLVNLLGVGDTLVVLAVAGRILPVDILVCQPFTQSLI